MSFNPFNSHGCPNALHFHLPSFVCLTCWVAEYGKGGRGGGKFLRANFVILDTHSIFLANSCCRVIGVSEKTNVFCSTFPLLPHKTKPRHK